MAAPVTAVEGGGLVLTGSISEPEPDHEVPTTEEQLASAVITRLRQGFPKAALSAAIDLVNTIKAEHDL